MAHPRFIARRSLAALAGVMLVMLCACGQKGPLYLPGEDEEDKQKRASTNATSMLARLASARTRLLRAADRA